MKFVGVSKCPVGVAHTYMATEKLQIVGEKLGHEVKIETQGSIGAENELTDKEIREADGVIIAADATVEGLSRFNGKKVLFASTNEAINDSERLFKEVLKCKEYVDKEETIQVEATKIGVIQHIMNGVGYMIPFIAVFGILAALASLFGGEATETGFVVAEGTIWKIIYETAKLGSTLMVPALGGYIAYSISGRAALAPAMISSMMVNTSTILGLEYGLGFLGAIIVGLITGYGVKYVLTIKVPEMIKGIMPTLIIPTIFVLFNTVLFYFILKYPVGFVFEFIMNTLNSLSGSTSGMLLMGALVGGMIAFDMGGPINKAALMFAMAALEQGNSYPMAAFAASAITAPLGLAIASIFAKSLFSKQERDLLPNTLAMCCVGFSEGAIPYAANDPKTVIPSNVVGGAVAGALAMNFGVTNIIIKGGPIPALIGGVNKPVEYFISILCGAVVTAFLVIILKRFFSKEVR